MKKRFMVYLLLVILLSSSSTALILGLYGHRSMRGLLETQKQGLYESIRHYLKIYDNILLLVEKGMADHAASALKALSREMTRGAELKKKAYAADELKSLARAHGVTDISLIDRQGIVFATSAENDLGLNLLNFSPRFQKFLESIYGQGEVKRLRTSISVSTHRLTLFALYSPPGADFIIEIWLDIKEFVLSRFSEESYEFLFHGFFSGLRKENRYLRDIDLFIAAEKSGLSASLLHEGKPRGEDLAPLMKDIEDKGERIIVDGDQVTIYYLVSLEDAQHQFTNKILVHLEYDFSPLSRFRRNMILYAGLISLLMVGTLFAVSSRWFNRYILDRIEAINRGVTDIAAGHYETPVSVAGDDDLTRIAENIVHMRDEILARENRLKENEKALIQARDRLEERVAERTAELAESEEKYRRVSEQANDGIVIVQDGRVRYANPRMEKMVGQPLSDVRDAHFERFLDPEVRPAVREQYRRRVAGKQVDSRYETVLLHRSGRRVIVGINAGLMEFEGREAVLGIVRDITDRKEAEDALRRAKVEAEAANRAKSEFLANMSHELRTPLNAVTGFSELLSSEVSDPRQRRYLDAVKSAGKTLLTLINDILDLSKIDAGRMEVQRTSVDLRRLFGDIEEVFRLKIAGKGLAFTAEVDPGLPPALFLDELRIRQILLNLVGNAVKFTDAGEIRLSARRMEERGDGRVGLAIAVADTGVGIPDADLCAIFEPFRQREGQRTHRYGGTGLGLSICKKLTELMDGDIAVSSRPGRGSVFEIRLKGVEPASPDAPAAAAPDVDVRHVRFQKARVLVVDDVESNREMLRELLTAVDLEVATAADGQEALLLAGEYKPDVILMDIRMPVLDGVEAMGQLNANPATADIPVIVLTASAHPRDRSDAGPLAPAGYLTKPVASDRLFHELARHLTLMEGPPVLQPADPAVGASPEEAEIKRRPDLVRTLRREIVPEMAALRDVMEADPVAAMARRLVALGRDHNAGLLLRYAERLRLAAESYDIDAVEDALSEFPDLLARLADADE